MTRPSVAWGDSPPTSPAGAERAFGVQGVLAALGVRREPVRCGRFELRDKLGAGGMGVVYRAFDPELARHVAVKLLKLGARDDGTALRKEAQAMARLSHPNVVEILAVGTDPAGTFIAMELVEGRTLGEWADDNPPAQRGRFEQAMRWIDGAGRGLAAAHAAGLVHRDFKPANVLLAPDGRAKVADFGLARTGPEPPSQPDLASLPGVPGMETTQEEEGRGALTKTGSVAGTPLYMAPEQHHGRRADARSDQYSFAVSAWEVLCGEPPFSGSTRFAILDAIERGAVRVPTGTGVPPSVFRALRRAMSVRPAERYPSMEALLAALQPRRASRGAALAAAGLGAAGLLMWRLIPSPAAAAPDPCDPERVRATVAATWDDARRERVREALLATDVPYALTAADTATRALDEFATAWEAERVQSCSSSQPQDTALDVRIDCLHGQMRVMDALVERFATATPELAERAKRASDGLPVPSTCRVAGQFVVPDDEEYRSLADKLAVAQGALLAGEYPSAHSHALRVAELATARGWEVLHSDALELVAEASSHYEAHDPVEPMLEAYRIAAARDLWDRAARRAAHGARLLATHKRREEAAQWIRHAEAAAERARDPDAARAELEHSRCVERKRSGALEEAFTHCTLALERYEALPQRDPAREWLVRSTLANIHNDLGRFDESIAINSALREQAIAERGASHPNVGGMWLNVATAHAAAGRHDEAEAAIREAMRVFEAAYGPNSRWVVSAWMNLGASRMRRKDFEGADEALAEALRRVGERRDSRTARVLLNISELRRRQGRVDEAVELLARVQMLEAEVLEQGDPQTAYTHQTRGNLLMQLDRFDEARQEFRIALEILGPSPDRLLYAKVLQSLAGLSQRTGQVEATVDYALKAAAAFRGSGASASELLRPLVRAAHLLLDSGRFDDARPLIEEAEALEIPDDAGTRLTSARLRLASSRLAHHDGDLDGARRLAREVLSAIEGLEDPRARELGTLTEQWLASLVG